ncbi:MAG: hypothetical protein WBA13_02460 [Microcoleaceae cyanobacterium]
MIFATELGTLKCNRLESISVNCQLTPSNFFGLNTTSIVIAEFKAAEVEVSNRTGYRHNQGPIASRAGLFTNHHCKKLR